MKSSDTIRFAVMLCAAAIALAPAINQARDPGAGRAARRAQAQTQAGTHDPSVNVRQHRERKRIGEGVRSGELTKEETKSLASEQKAIHQEEKEYKSDGTLSKDERKDLHKDLNEASKDVYQQKHDDDKQPDPAPATRDPGVNTRQVIQKDRIVQGVKSGELTKEETKTLASEKQTIRQEEKEMKSDGTLTKDERKDLHKDLNEASKDIYQEKHDDETR